MATFSDFLPQLLNHGRIVFRSAGAPNDPPTERDVAILAEAFEVHALSVAGPRIGFDPRAAREAAELVRQASWALVNRDDRASDLKKRLTMTGTPRTPSQHLSADLMLRFVPQIARRARGLDPIDPLAEMLAAILRRWPLSGVLSDAAEGPGVPIEFEGHPGLSLLYAERLSVNDRPAWHPRPTSPAWGYFELVQQERSNSRFAHQPGENRSEAGSGSLPTLSIP